MYEFEGSKKRKKVLVLQLAPMIDIFVLVIVFLLKGTVMSETAVTAPESVKLAKSESRESTEVAPEVYISETHIEFKMINFKMSMKEILNDNLDPKDLIFSKLADFHLRNGKELGLRHINLVVDYRVTYKAIYHVVRILRAAGFKSMLFIAEDQNS